jgi:SAM-dependent methyltransferase
VSTVEVVGPARRQSMQQWERAEIARSAVEADLTADNTLRVAPEIYARYVSPPADTAYPLEFAFHLIGDVRGKRIVDLGCGSGANTALLVNRGAQVWGIDISEDLLRLGRRRLAVSGCPGAATFVAGSAHDLPFPDTSIDVVFGMAILHHVDLDLAAREVLRVLKPGGRAIFQEPVRNSAALGFLRRLVPYRAPDISPFERPLTDGELGRFAEGFSRYAARAFELPPVQTARVFRRLRNRCHSLYEWDRRLLRAAPWLARYASIRVISLTK